MKDVWSRVVWIKARVQAAGAAAQDQWKRVQKLVAAEDQVVQDYEAGASLAELAEKYEVPEEWIRTLCGEIG